MKHHESHSPRAESGMTVMEMMIAMLIAVIILAGLVTIFASMRRSFSTTRALNQLVNQQQFASMVLTNAISSAGYYPATNRTIRGLYPTAETAFPVVSTTLGQKSIDFATAGQFVYGTGSTGKQDNDVVAVRLINNNASEGPFDCLGGAGGGTGNLYSVFWVDTANNQLMCATNNYPNGQPLLGGNLQRGPGLPANLHDGVKYLTAEYGIDTNRDGSVDRFMSANTLNNATTGYKCPDVTTGTGNSSSCWPYVRSVRFTLGFITSLNNGSSPVYLTRTVRLNNTNGMTLDSMPNVVVGN